MALDPLEIIHSCKPSVWPLSQRISWLVSVLAFFSALQFSLFVSLSVNVSHLMHVRVQIIVCVVDVCCHTVHEWMVVNCRWDNIRWRGRGWRGRGRRWRCLHAETTREVRSRERSYSQQQKSHCWGFTLLPIQGA